MTETNAELITNYNSDIKIKHDGQISIATANNKTSKHWKNKVLLWSEFVEKLSHTTRTPETYAEYKKMSKTDRDRIKDVGGFCGGSLKNGRRKAENVANRTVLTLDLDYVVGDVWSSIELLWDFGCLIYSTHTHASDNQRLRLVIPLSRPVLPDEYQAISRMIADDLGIDQFDDTTYEPSRLMYGPSTSCDGEYIFKVQDLEWLNPDDVLNRYIFGWEDISYWPESSRARAKISSAIKRQEDPLEKKGVIGAFCRTYSISEAIGEFLSDTYTGGADETRYTYTEGSTSGGLVIYEDKFSFSHHGTDPTSGMLCNSFDLIRIHKFGELDDDAKDGTPQASMPSFIKMKSFASSDKNVLVTMGKEKMVAAQEDFGTLDTDEESNTEWLTKLEYTEQGKLKPTSYNYKMILLNEPTLKSKFKYNEFSVLIEKTSLKLPWKTRKKAIEDNDIAELKSFIQRAYSINNNTNFIEGLTMAAYELSFHPVREYLDNLKWDGEHRGENILIDYMGAEDTEYTRAVLIKMLLAAITRVYHPGSKFDCMLVLQGKQGLGKSELIKRLAHNIEWFSDNKVDIDDSKKVIENYGGRWLIEIAELDGFNKKENGAIKRFITTIQYISRMAFMKSTTTYLVQYILFGTTNEPKFLTDKTGNRRFWVVKCDPEKVRKNVFDLSENDINQIWAEILIMYKEYKEKGCKNYLLLNEKQKKYVEEIQKDFTKDDLGDVIQDKFNFDAPTEKWCKSTPTDLLSRLNLSDSEKRLAKQNLKITLEDRFGIVQNRSKSFRYYIIPPLRTDDPFETVGDIENSEQR